MIRTQIQLTEKQARKLKDMAKAKNVSVSELIRQGIGLLLKNSSIVDSEERKKRALQAVGKFRSGLTDISEKHDEYLGEDLKS
jgi:Arc/MetJ-type ribon-helix-helix transcriptional regulator